MNKKHSKIWLGFLASGLVASLCSSSIAGDFPENDSTNIPAVGAVSASEAEKADAKESADIGTSTVSSISNSDAKKENVPAAAPRALMTSAPVSVANAQSLTQTSAQPIMNAPVSSGNHTFTVGPAASLGAPMGFGASYGQAFIGAAGLTRHPVSHRIDGALAVGFGLGDPDEYIGATVVVDVDSVNAGDGGFGSDGALAVSVSRNLPALSAVSFGVSRFGVWGEATENKATLYAAASKIFVLNPADASNPFPLTISAGLGNGAYRSMHDQNLGKKNAVGYFGSVALGVHPQLSLIADYASSIFQAGFSVVPMPTIPVVVTLSLYDLNKQYDNKVKMAGAVGYAFTY